MMIAGKIICLLEEVVVKTYIDRSWEVIFNRGFN